MENRTRKRILLIMTNGFAATNVIQSGLIKPLAQMYDIYIYSDLLTESSVNELSSELCVKLSWINAEIPSESTILKLLRRLEKAIFFHHFNIVTQAIKEKGSKGIFKYVIRTALRIISVLSVDQSLLIALRKQIIKKSAATELAKEINIQQFNGIISTSPFDMRENIIINAVKPMTRTMAMVISWDNLTTKGLINAHHDYILVWNKFMKAEYQQYYRIFNTGQQRICITGVPRFDIYFQPKTSLSQEALFRRTYKAGTGDKIILFATSAAKHFPAQREIVQHLIDYSEMNRGVKVIIRCHPADSSRLYAGLTQHPNIFFWYAADNCVNGNQYTPKSDALTTLVHMLKYTDVCINVASTIRLEAAACNKPVLSIAYDGDRIKPYAHSVARYYDYTHQLRLNQIGIDKMIFSKQELFHALTDILFTNAANCFDRTMAVREFTHFSSPEAIPATLNFISEWLH